MQAAKEEEIRLYSKATKCPVDIIAPQHEEIHADLERWGAWNRDRYRPKSCTSMEKNYHRGRGDQAAEYPKLPVSLPASAKNRQVDRAVIRLPMQHRETVRLFYVEKKAPMAICRLIVLRWADFPRWMFDCRCMVLNVLRVVS